ncbi:hypothetical protein G4O51_06915 [Candidatus Bathyarchaeota archaeon A05DMB-2]|nr:hypothetical protein [Candidatus Bathyarchaeota archaeon A05DMB-2]
MTSPYCAIFNAASYFANSLSSARLVALPDHRVKPPKSSVSRMGRIGG